MPLISIAEASRLTGKDRRTIERYLKSGRLSYTTDVARKRSIETSELIRVFGNLSHNVAHADVAQNHDTPHPFIATTDDGEKAALKDHIRTLEHQLDERTKEARELRSQITGLLEYRKSDKEKHIKPRLNWWKLGLAAGFVFMLIYFFLWYRPWFLL